MKRGKIEEVTCQDVTDTLIRAAERASEIEATHVIVVLYTQKGDENGSYDMSCMSSQNVTVETANWMMDKVKDWLIREDPE